MSDRFALVLDEDGALGPVSLRLIRMGIPVLYARWADEATLLAHQEKGRIGALVVQPSVDLADATALLQLLQASLTEGRVALVVIGERPDGARCAELRAAGARHAVWSAGDDSLLRSAMNAALARPSELAPRKEPRGSVSLMAWIGVGSTRSYGVLSSLSARGAYIETSSPLPHGASFQLEFTVEKTTIHTRAKVVSHNGPDQVRAANVPLGMSVTFQGLDPATEEMLRAYAKKRATDQTV